MNQNPWYRQLWPWLIIAPPAASVAAGIALLCVAIASADGVVAPARHHAVLTPAQAAECSVKDRACLNAPVEEKR
jgi:hypothetical protein